MKRNFNRDYLKKLSNTITPNGYKFDLMNYLHNPAYGYDYPRFTKILEEGEEFDTRRDVLYFKYHDGTGEYIAETYKVPKGEGWHIMHETKKEVLAEGNRFNLNTLISLC